MYRCPVTLDPFYVGYGKNQRSHDHLTEAINYPEPIAGEHKLNTIRKILRQGNTPIISIIDDNLSKIEACELEEFLIEFIGRRDLGTGVLTNQTKGGDGNREWSVAARQKHSMLNKDKISVRDKNGNYFKVDKTDSQWMSGDLVGHNAGKKGITNKNGKLTGYIQAKDKITGQVYRVKKDDTRWISGELVGIQYGKPASDNIIEAAKARKGIKKTDDHAAKVGKAFAGASWIHNFSTGQTKRLTKGNTVVPDGFLKVTGPHTKIPI